MEETPDYNKLPVFYCKHCLSLAVKTVDAKGSTIDYCAACGSTNIGSSDIYKWRKKFFARHGRLFSKYTDKKR